VDGDDQRIMAGGMFAGASSQEPLRVAAAESEFDQPLDSDISEDRYRKRVHALSNSSPAQVKPGPKAVSITVFGKPRSISRWSTKRTVGALMLP
jgi:hypothetical protein